jgi:antitoxin MazE
MYRKAIIEGVCYENTYYIQKWGNSLAIRITGPLKTIPHFTANMPVEIEVDERELTIHPVTSKKRKLFAFNEAQLLKGLTAKKAHADEFLEDS